MSRARLEGELANLHPASFGWALGCCKGERGEAEDVLQAAYLKVLEGRARYDVCSAFKTWLFAVIRRPADDGEEPGLERRAPVVAGAPFQHLEVRGLEHVLRLPALALAAAEGPAEAGRVEVRQLALQPGPRHRRAV